MDGTYELFRHHFALPARSNQAGEPVAATRGVLGSVLQLLEAGATHLGVATDHVIESFRNDMWPGYKTSAGMPAELLAQFGLLEDALGAMGIVVWPMVEFEADDALAAAADRCAADLKGVSQVRILTPDKDLAQCVVGRRVVQVDRRSSRSSRSSRSTGSTRPGQDGESARDAPGGKVTDAEGVVARYGVEPASIPDWLGLVGDSADGFPGLPGWGAKSAAAVLARYGHLETIPVDGARWSADGIALRSPRALAETLVERLEEALLFRELATLRLDTPVHHDLDELAWRGPTSSFPAMCERLEDPRLAERAATLAERRPR
ncbi:MAG: 5'-3' exonuclease [Acidimicrobiales bacterium]